MNKVIIIGRLTKDPELIYAAGSGIGVTRFTVAVTRTFKKDEADFINCVAFGKTAEIIAQYLTKGRQIVITGNIRTGSYDKDGEKRYTTDVNVESFEFVGDNKGQASNQSNNNDDAFSGGWGMPEDYTPTSDEPMPF
ncbi:single-stranded DNA-binding protein [Clostridium paraputrificum]|uniref:single-stranded DNA-binding protein n=1 Tax=Clostridium paraputrificum TaxID=29363 RepID=UPI003D34001D